MLRPELLTDETLGRLPDPLVLFYLKLWLVTDDDGYFDWKPGQIAATLYPYRGDRVRTIQVARWLSSLVEVRRVRLLDCGVHGVIPTIRTYRIQGGKQSSTYRLRHQETCISRPVRTDLDKYASLSLSHSNHAPSRDAGARDEKLGDAAIAEGGFVGRIAAGKRKS